MKLRYLFLTACAAALALAARADLFLDATGDTFFGGILDIASVDVVNDASTLTFTINLVGDPVATDWGKYMIGFDTTAGGDTAGNGWGRPISMSTGMDYWIGSWADSGNGVELYSWSGSWGLDSATTGLNPANLAFSKDTSSVTITMDLAALGLGVGNSFLFDVYTSGGGGGDGAVDALSTDSQTIADWGDAFQSGGALDRYTVVPEPAMLGLVAAGALVLGLRRRRKD